MKNKYLLLQLIAGLGLGFMGIIYKDTIDVVLGCFMVLSVKLELMFLEMVRISISPDLTGQDDNSP